jgi:hypothetical protein
LAAPPIGVLLISLAYAQAIHGSGQGYVAWFWVGMLTGGAPLVVFAAGRAVPRPQRHLTLAALAIFTFAPKYLRNATGPLYFDERAHWLQVRQVVTGHHLFIPNDAVPVIQYYPGLHAFCAALAQMTGLSVWVIAEIVIALVHVLAALAVVSIAESLMPPRAAAIAAVVYMTNPEWVYFDAQFAYESLGLTLALWTIAFVARLIRARHREERLRWTALSVAAGSICVITHHLSTVSLCAILVLCTAALAVGTALVPRPTETRPWTSVVWLVGTTALISAALGGYLAWVAPSTTTYLGSAAGNALRELCGLAGLAGSSPDGARTPFSGSQAPIYERIAAFAAPVAVGVLVAWHVWSRRAGVRRWRPGLAPAMGCLACVYLASVPLVMTAEGSEVARRSWAFSYLGVAVVAGWVASVMLRTGRFGAVVGVGGGLALLLVGNLAAGENVAYRFPGPYIFGSDSRSVTADMLAAEAWWQQVRAPGTGVVADRYNGVLYQAAPGGKVASVTQGPISDFYLDSTAPSPYLAQTLDAQGYDYLVIDKNITEDVPLLGVYFAPDEPGGAGGSMHPVPSAVIERWARSPYTTRVYDSDQMSIYRFDPRFVSARWP